MHPISLLVISPQAIVSAGVRSLLAEVPDIDVRVGGVADLRHRPRVALIHFGPTGLQQLDLPALVAPKVSVLGLIDPHHEALEPTGAGIRCLDLSVSSTDLAVAVRTGAERAGATVVPRGTDRPIIATLSPRELEILLAMTRGLSNQAIAAELYLGVNTVKTYIRTAYRRIGVRSRTQALLWCARNSLVTDHRPPTQSTGPRAATLDASRLRQWVA